MLSAYFGWWCLSSQGNPLWLNSDVLAVGNKQMSLLPLWPPGICALLWEATPWRWNFAIFSSNPKYHSPNPAKSIGWGRKINALEDLQLGCGNTTSRSLLSLGTMVPGLKAQPDWDLGHDVLTYPGPFLAPLKDYNLRCDSDSWWCSAGERWKWVQWQ